VRIALLVYAVGVLIGLLVMRDRFIPRLVTAFLWPIGPITGIVVVCGLVLVAVILWPLPMLLGAALVGGAVYLLV
jgi:hypothetical protein